MVIKSQAADSKLIFPELKGKGFRIHEISGAATHSVARGRRDFYKIGLVTGDMTVCYDDKVVEINDTALFFVNPNVPHSVVRRSVKTTGYACLFTETFISGRGRMAILKKSPLFDMNSSPVILLNTEQAAFMRGVFQKMMLVHGSGYAHKDELLNSCIELLIHEALTLQPQQNELQYKNGATRITSLFVDLLERQFPIERTDETLRLRTARDFAAGLSVHVNYLNRSVKEVTGKPTSAHIAGRIVTEAKALLQHTDWSVASIAWCLGFEYPTYFNNYFKRVTGSTPNSFRKD